MDARIWFGSIKALFKKKGYRIQIELSPRLNFEQSIAFSILLDGIAYYSFYLKVDQNSNFSFETFHKYIYTAKPAKIKKEGIGENSYLDSFRLDGYFVH